MPSLNKVQIIGNLGQDPEVKYGSSGKAFCKLSVATTDKWKDKDGNDQEFTEWHRVAVFGKTAENVGQYLEKGRSVYVEGYLRTHKWEDKEGVERWSTEVMAQRIIFLGSRDGGGGGGRRPETPDESFDGDVPF